MPVMLVCCVCEHGKVVQSEVKGLSDGGQGQCGGMSDDDGDDESTPMMHDGNKSSTFKATEI